MVKKQYLEYLKDFKSKLGQTMSIQKVYLFGSRARGKAHKWSDFDLLIVSKSFKDKASFERAVGLHKYWTIDSPVDFLCYTPEEFDKLKKQVTIVRQAVEEGVEI